MTPRVFLLFSGLSLSYVYNHIRACRFFSSMFRFISLATRKMGTFVMESVTKSPKIADTTNGMSSPACMCHHVSEYVIQNETVHYFT